MCVHGFSFDFLTFYDSGLNQTNVSPLTFSNSLASTSRHLPEIPSTSLQMTNRGSVFSLVWNVKVFVYTVSEPSSIKTSSIV